MGPKKKGKDEKKEEEVVSDYDTMDLEMLREVVPMLRQQLEKGMLDRNYVQLERDAIQQYFDITKREVNELDLSIAAKEREMELMEDNHRVELRVYEQKVKHLEYENRRDIKGVVNTGQASLENETEQHNDREAELLRKKEELKFYQKELELTNASKVQEVRQQHEKQLVKLQQQFSESLAELEKRCEARLYRLKEDLELRRRMEVHEVEERKNKHINDLADNHKRAFGQMKSYYNEITGSNLQLIRDLQKQIETLKTRAIEHKDNLIEITKENQRLSEPLAVAKTEIAELQSSLKERIKDQMALRNARSRLASINRNAVEMRANQHHLEEQYLLAERERDQLFSSFEESVALVKQQSDFANLSLEQRLRVAEAETDKSAQQVQEIISAGKLDPTEMVRVMGSLNQMLTAKDDALTSIRFLVVKLKKTFNDALATYTAKMKELGVPTYEIESMGYNSERLPDGSTNAPSGLLVEG